MHITRPTWFLLLLSLALAGSAQAAPSSHSNSSHSNNSQKGVAFKWVDEQGVVHYGDHVPPQYATEDRTILNSQGVEVGHVAAQKSAEAQAADARQRAEQMKQKQHDAFLVSTYTSEKDIEALRDVRLDQLKGQRVAAEQYLESLRVRLSTLQSRALSYRPYSERADARRMPDDVAENLVRTVNELREYTGTLTTNTQAETSLRAQFQADLERYRQLHSVHSQ